MRANEKKCADCGKVKHKVLFSRDAKREDGRQIYCKVCMKPRYAAYRNRFTTALMTPQEKEKQGSANFDGIPYRVGFTQ